MIEPTKQSKPRRSKGEGTIAKVKGRKDLWSARITVGTSPTGKRIRKTVYGPTKRHVTDELSRLRNQKLDGTLKAVSRLTVAEFMQQWLNTSAVLRVKRTTLDNYRQNVRLHIDPNVGTIRLDKLSPVNVMNIYATMSKAGKSTRTQQLVHTILRRALVMAVKWRLVSFNVCDTVDRPPSATKRSRWMPPMPASCSPR